jgi:hypothetical protein
MTLKAILRHWAGEKQSCSGSSCFCYTVSTELRRMVTVSKKQEGGAKQSLEQSGGWRDGVVADVVYWTIPGPARRPEWRPSIVSAGGFPMGKAPL